jgi:hypothetical protein
MRGVVLAAAVVTALAGAAAPAGATNHFQARTNQVQLACGDTNHFQCGTGGGIVQLVTNHFQSAATQACTVTNLQQALREV